MRRRWGSFLALALLAGLAAACGSVEGQTSGDAARTARPAAGAVDTLAAVPDLPALPPWALQAMTGPARLRVRDVQAVTKLGAQVDIDVVEIVARAPVSGPAGGRTRLDVELVRLVEPSIVSPPDTIDTPFDPFLSLGPRIHIDRVVIEDAYAAARAHPSQFAGEYLWRVRDLDLTARDLRLGGTGEPEGVRLSRLSLRGERLGEPFRIPSASAVLTRTPTRLTWDASARIGSSSRLGLTGALTRSGSWRLDLAADTLVFPELRFLHTAVPREGGMTGRVLATGGGSGPTMSLRGVRVGIGQSVVAANGDVILGPDAGAQRLLVEADPLYTADLERALAAELPVQGMGAVRLETSGTARGGLSVLAEARLVDTTGVESRVTADGLVRLRPRPWFDLRLHGNPVVVADSALWVDLAVVGRPDSLALMGDVALANDTTTTAAIGLVVRDRGESPRLARGRVVVQTSRRVLTAGSDAPPARLSATIEGSAELASTGRLDLRIHGDSIPLGVFPWPEALDSVSGTAGGELTVRGTVEEPLFQGRLDLHDVGLSVPDAGLRLDSLAGPILVEEEEVRIPSLRGRAGNGEVRLAATGRYRDRPLSFTARLEADSVRAVEMEDAWIVASARLDASGTLEAPRIGGEVVLEGGEVREDVFRTDPMLDLEDPPYADVARRAPWIANSRLLGPEREEAIEGAQAAPAPPRFSPRGEITVHVTPGLSVVDEDSELRGTGEIRVQLDGDGGSASGIVRVQEGFYALFGERFRVVGGAFVFAGSDEPRVGLLAVHEVDPPLGSGSAESGSAARFPLEFLGHGAAAAPREELRRPALLPEDRTDLAGLLFFGVEPQPVTGWRHTVLWLPNSGKEVVGERAEAQLVPLVWSYAADEAYDYVPLSVGYFRAGIIKVGSPYPARQIVGPYLRGAALFGPRVELVVSQALEGGVAPGARLRYRLGNALVEAFGEPRFYAAVAAGRGYPGFSERRRLGVGFRWEF